MDYQPPLRNYSQMVRVIREKADSVMSYQLGNAYGNTTDSRVLPTEQRIRTLNEMNLPSTSLRRPELPAVEGFLSTRASSTLFHELNGDTRQYVSGQGGPQAIRRSDGDAGTKMRTERNPNAFSKHIYTSDPMTTLAPPTIEKDMTKSSQKNPVHFTGGFNAFKA